MGEIADKLINGKICHECNDELFLNQTVYTLHKPNNKLIVKEENFGFPVLCESCYKEYKILNKRVKTPYKDINKEIIYTDEEIEYDDESIGFETKFRNTGYIVKTSDGKGWCIDTAHTFEMEDFYSAHVVKVKK